MLKEIVEFFVTGLNVIVTIATYAIVVLMATFLFSIPMIIGYKFALQFVAQAFGM